MINMNRELDCAVRYKTLVIIRTELFWRAVGTHQNEMYCVPTAR